MRLIYKGYCHFVESQKCLEIPFLSFLQELFKNSAQQNTCENQS